MLDEFFKCFQSINFCLKLVGLSQDPQDDQRTLLQRLYRRPIFAICFISNGVEGLAEFFWLLEAVKTNKTFLEITFILPCFTLCILSLVKSFFILFYAQCSNDLRQRLHMLQSELISSEPERKAFVTQINGTHISRLNTISKCIHYVMNIGVVLFMSTPLLIMLTQYHSKGEVEYILPLFGIYPFDTQDIKYYICVYIHQALATFITGYFVFGPIYLYFTCCTFIHIQFLILQYDMERVVPDNISRTDHHSLKLNMRKVAIRHIELMRCVELLDILFSKSILMNALTSSIIICITGFNVMNSDEIITIASFTMFLSFSLSQIFVYCYNGDYIMRSSLQVSEAIYNSQWYNTEYKERTSFLIILTRAQQPCKITAYSFFDINLEAFTSILSTSWSYFALLKTMYQPDQMQPE